MAITIRICKGTSGISAGAEKVEAAFREELAKHDGLLEQCTFKQSGDRGLFRDVLVDIDTPDTGPVTYENLDPGAIPRIVERHLLKGKPVGRYKAKDGYDEFFAGQERILLANCGEIDPENIDDYLAAGGYEALKKALAMPRDEVIETVKQAGLRGRGGAGFPTGLKWEFSRKAESAEKFIVCNADEGDPGAFMDRSLLESDPHAILEGMAIAAYAVGAQSGYIYCRAEYPLALKRLAIALEQARERGFLGSGILGSDFNFDLQVKEGAGAFVCGEETALIASIEGKRGMPTPRPPYPAQSGLWGASTCINNVETFANVRHIITRGADWFASIGTGQSKGTKVFALAGKVKNTGLVEVPMGTTIRAIIDGPGGGLLHPHLKLKGVQLGGPSGGCIPEDLLDTPIDYESINATGAIMGSGGMVVMDERTCMVDVAKFFLAFTVEESCGKCVPCRIGLKRMHEVLEEITSGTSREGRVAFLEEMGETILKTALCGLGNTAPNPVLTTLRYFRGEYEAHTAQHECPAHVCGPLLHFEVIEERCTKCGECFPACPAGAIEWEAGKTAYLNQDKCTKCRACYTACPHMAIR